MFLNRFYPSSEGFLLNLVDKDDLFGYVFSGFALVRIGDVKYYVSYNKPSEDPLFIKVTPELVDVFRPKVKGQSNLSGFIKLFSKFQVIRAHYQDTEEAWKRVKAELAKEEFKETLEIFSVTIATLINKLFPGFIA